MMQIAVRHGAATTNPVAGVSSFRKTKRAARGKIADMAALPAFRAQVRTWARGEEIPGTPAYVSGPPRDWTMVWVVDVITGTGIRPHVVFALLLEDIHLEEDEPYLDITGTLIEVKGEGHRRLGPQARTKIRKRLAQDTSARPHRRSDRRSDPGPEGQRPPQPARHAVSRTQRISPQPQQLRQNLARRTRFRLRLGEPSRVRDGSTWGPCL